ncbi:MULTISPECIES: OmpA family protein [unclassified Salipiger]|uniref:OmpA family protein n=1 Tax=unclassified Salipiger TaxID=2640570 RepID=UPI0013B97F6C|nr:MULTISPECIES: OmpA family protein [unclassified Salipiger]NDV48217.1 OmpA family protein [Salipiger sp. PrR003]NDW35445.1 OmpA family protein [Salipiger sp. PrR007]
MRLSGYLLPATAFAAAAALCAGTAYFSMQMVETASRQDVADALLRDGQDWAEVDVNGLQVFLIGTAPDEAARFRAMTVAGSAVDSARVIDQMLVADAEEIQAPRFSMEILRNESGISIIGLVPGETDRERLLGVLSEMTEGDQQVADLLEEADFPKPEGWGAAVDFAGRALEDLPRSKISVSAGRVHIKAMTDSESDRREIERTLRRRAPNGVDLTLDLSAPRPVITPFTLRFLMDEEGPRFDACSADTEAARERILKAAQDTGFEGTANCRLGLGVPSRRWGEAGAMAISAVKELGGGSVTFSNADVSLVALEGTSQGLFDRVVGELDTALPQVFALHATLPETPQETDQGPPEFTATLSPEGSVQLRGRINSDLSRETADSLAKALFGSDSVYTAARVVEGLPNGWSTRVLTGLEALGQLSNGALRVTPELVRVSGNTGNKDANAEIAGLLSDKLGEGADYEIDVTYQEKLDPELGIPTPEQCEAQIVEIIGDRKISFEPGSANLDSSAKDIMDELADLLKLCGDIPLEIQGHTDSQGRESMNEALSRDRAQSVLDALRNRRVLTSSYRVKGYGETLPIADNSTEEGREANRRIEFKLIRPEPTEEEPTALEQIEQEGAEATGESGASEESDAAQDNAAQDEAGTGEAGMEGAEE